MAPVAIVRSLKMHCKRFQGLSSDWQAAAISVVSWKIDFEKAGLSRAHVEEVIVGWFKGLTSLVVCRPASISIAD